jgi:hypothetical protein
MSWCRMLVHAMIMVHVVAVMVYRFGSCGEPVGCSCAWNAARYFVCSPSQGICRSIVLLSSNAFF